MPALAWYHPAYQNYWNTSSALRRRSVSSGTEDALVTCVVSFIGVPADRRVLVKDVYCGTLFVLDLSGCLAACCQRATLPRFMHISRGVVSAGYPEPSVRLGSRTVCFELPEDYSPPPCYAPHTITPHIDARARAAVQT